MLKTGLNRDIIDKFYTSEDISKKCIKKFIKYVNPNKSDLVIEPSAGNGSFSNILTVKFKNTIFYDIEPENENIIKADFLQTSFNKNNCHIIGNPPFGRQSSLAKKFIKHCIGVNSISFILPKSFKKDSYQSIFPLNYHLIYEFDIPDNSFVLDKKIYNVPCVFQIWIMKENYRQITEVKINNLIQFVKKDDNPHYAIRRVGVYSGKLIKDNISELSKESHYFIKLLPNISTTEFEEKYNKIVFIEKDFTVGPRSISKKELINKLC
jgi:hypothetical protein